EERYPTERERHAALQREERDQDRHRGEQKAAQHSAQEGALAAASPLRHRFLASHRLLGLLAGLDDLGDFLVASDVVLELLEAGREPGAGAATPLVGVVFALAPLRDDSLELHLTGRTVPVVSHTT